VPLSHKTPFDYTTHKSTPNLRPKPTSTHQHTMHAGWMDGWMDGGCGQEALFHYILSTYNYPHASTYLPTYLPGSPQSEVGIRNCTKPSPPPGIKVDNHGYEKKSNTQFLSITMGLKKSNTQLLYNWSSQFFSLKKNQISVLQLLPGLLPVLS
jgi:hypothetical protein